jgi:hypothetical protein
MKRAVTKTVLGLVVAGLLSSPLAMTPAVAKSSNNRGRVVVGVVAIGAIVALFHRHHKHHSNTTTVQPPQPMQPAQPVQPTQ